MQELKQLEMHELELSWREIVCKRSVADPAGPADASIFSQGIQDFSFSVSGKNAWIPAYSYFRADITVEKLTAGANARIPTLADNIALSDVMPGCLYNNIYFRAGGQDISSITQFVPQAAALKCRLDNSGAWLKYVGRDGMGCDSDFTRRKNKISIDGQYHEDGLVVTNDTVEKPKRKNNGEVNNAATIEWDPATGKLTCVPGNAAANSNFLESGLKPGDIVKFPATAQSILVSNAPITNAEAFGVSLGLPDAVAANAAATINSVADPRAGKNRLFVTFQPPIGIFDLHQGIGSGDFKIQLNPNANYKRACLESLGKSNGTVDLVPGVDYNVRVNNVTLYVCQVKKDMPASGVVQMMLREMQLLNKTLNVGTSTNQLDFTVPPSTYALTVFVQSNVGASGTDTRLPPTRFKTIDTASGATGQEENLAQIQVTYGSVSKPSTLYSSEYSDNDNRMVQRWLSSQYHSKKINNQGGTEAFNEWMDRGPYYHFDFQRDKMDSSTYVNVQISFGAPGLPAGCQLMLVAHYTRQVELSYESGYVTQVVSTNR